MNVVGSVTTVVLQQPGVSAVELVGSRSRDDACDLSEWDFRIEASDLDLLMWDLPELVQPLRPLSRQWDRLSTQSGLHVGPPRRHQD